MSRYAILFFIMIFFSCEKEVTFNFEHEPKLCLNCILNPDSTITANLSLSKKLDKSDNFEPVENANIYLYEGDILLGKLQNIGKGDYRLSRKPIIGKEYTITAVSNNYKKVKATTMVPAAPEIVFSKDTTGLSEYGDQVQYNLNVKIMDKPGKDFYWLYDSYYVGGVFYGGGCRAINAPYVDNFNRSIDSEAKYGFTHFLQIRMTDEGYDGQVLSFIIPDFSERDEYTAQHFLNADEHYDKYIKTTIINKMKEDSELPFYEPVQIYSNIENGYGIFGSCAITTIKLSK